MSVYLCCKPKFLSSDKLVTWILLCTLYWQMSSNPIWGLGTSQKPNASSLNDIEVRIEHDSSSSEWMTELDETNLQTTGLFCQLEMATFLKCTLPM